VGTAQASIAPGLSPAEINDESMREGSKREIVMTPALSEDAVTSAVAGPSRVQGPTKQNLSKVSPDVRGHTSYLTFARLVPFPLPPDPPGQGGDSVPVHAS